MSGFNANVPARKPRTRIGQVLSELTAEVEEKALDRPLESEDADAQADAEIVVEEAEESEAAVEDDSEGEEAKPRKARNTKASRSKKKGASAAAAEELPAAGTPSDGSRLAAGRERVAALR